MQHAKYIYQLVLTLLCLTVVGPIINASADEQWTGSLTVVVRSNANQKPISGANVGFSWAPYADSDDWYKGKVERTDANGEATFSMQWSTDHPSMAMRGRAGIDGYEPNPADIGRIKLYITKPNYTHTVYLTPSRKTPSSSSPQPQRTIIIEDKQNEPETTFVPRKSIPAQVDERDSAAKKHENNAYDYHKRGELDKAIEEMLMAVNLWEECYNLLRPFGQGKQKDLISEKCGVAHWYLMKRYIEKQKYVAAIKHYDDAVRGYLADNFETFRDLLYPYRADIITAQFGIRLQALSNNDEVSLRGTYGKEEPRSGQLIVTEVTKDLSSPRGTGFVIGDIFLQITNTSEGWCYLHGRSQLNDYITNVCSGYAGEGHQCQVMRKGKGLHEFLIVVDDSGS